MSQVFIIICGGIMYTVFPIPVRIVQGYIYPYPQVAPGWESSPLLQFLVGPWYRWDASWYVRIAVEGYQTGDPGLAFPPIYPFLVKGLGWFLGGEYLLAGMVISQISLFGTCFLLFDEFKKLTDPATAQRAVQYLLIFPTVFFFFIGYSEAFFLFLVVLCWQAAQRDEWVKAGLFGVVATLTRFAGVFLIPPLGYLWFRTRGRQKIKAAFFLGLIPLAFISWGLLTKQKFGWFPWEALDNNWDLKWDWPWIGILGNLNIILRSSMLQHYYHYYIHVDLLVALIFIGLTIWAFRKLPLEYGLLMSGFLVMALSKVHDAGFLISASRYVLPVFPGYLILAEWGKNRWFHRVWFLLSILLMVLLLGNFIFWGWVG